jgi:hypothetical protein
MTEVQKLEKTLFQDNSAGDIKFFPGSSRNVTAEEISEEVNKFFAGLRSE